MTSASAAQAAPSAPTELSASRLDSHTPRLSGRVSDTGGAQVIGKLFVRTPGSTSWNLVNGTSETAASGSVVSFGLPARPAGTRFEWRLDSCNSAGASCVSSAVRTDRVSPTLAAGNRPSTTRLPFTVSDAASVAVDVGTGNAQVDQRLLTLPGATGDVPIVLTYNSYAVGSDAPSAVTGTTGSGWSITGFDQRVQANADGSVTYRGPGGRTGLFLPVSGGGFTSPAGFKMALATVPSTSGGGWKITEYSSGQVLTFTAAGRLATVADRNGNLTTFTLTSGGLPQRITSSRGATATRTVEVTTVGGRISALTQTVGSLTRTVSLGADSRVAAPARVTDATGKSTSYTFTANGAVASVTNPAGNRTDLAYTGTSGGTATPPAAAAVASVKQVNTATGSPGDSVTRLAYPSTSQTLLADASTDQFTALTPTSSVPRTTYALTADNTGRVASATDPVGNRRERTYTGRQDVASDTTAAGTAGAGTSTFAYGTNSGESLTSATSPGGASARAAYANTAVTGRYLPSSLTDDAGNQTSFTYNGAGNQLTTADASTIPASVSYNTDGTVATSTAPGATQSTSYGYDTTKNLTSITPVAGSSLRARAYTWDGYGRLATATDGRGNTTTYSYDAMDRVTKVDYSHAGTTDVTLTYDTAGRLTTRTDASGTTTFGYDDLGRLTSRANTAGGGTIAYRYTLDGLQASVTDTRGTTTYTYNAARQLTIMTYPKGTGTQRTRFAYDSAGRRTDTWLQSTNPDNSTWAARSHTDYDTSGRVTRVYADRGPAATATRAMDLRTCYAAGAVYPNCPTTASSDRAKIRWEHDAVSGATTTYDYDTSGRLSKATTAGGPSPVTHSYTYDARGNRLTATRTPAGGSGGTASTQSLAYNQSNQITTAGYGYDSAGNLTTSPVRTATFNTAGQQTSIVKGGVTTTYTYAGTNQDELTAQLTGSGASYRYAYGAPDRNGLPRIEQVQANNQTAYIEHDNTGTPIMLRTSTGTVSLYIYDGRGNPVGLVTDSATQAFAYRYDPYGVPALTATSDGNGTTQNPYSYQGGTQDRDTGQIKFGQRWYDPTTGRFTQQDALNAPLDPLNANRYAYAGNDPINYTDPTGAYTYDELYDDAGFVGTTTGIGAAVGAAVGSIVPGAGTTVGGAYGGAVGASFGVGVAIGVRTSGG